MTIYLISPSHVETVLSLSQQKPDHYIHVMLDLDDMDFHP